LRHLKPMPARFKYNAATLRFERVTFSWVSAVLYGFGLLMFGSVFFVGLVKLQNWLIETPAERALRQEQKLLTANYPVMQARLAMLGAQLATIRESENQLHQKLFDAPASETLTSSSEKEHLFTHQHTIAFTRAEWALQQARLSSYRAAKKLTIDKSHLARLSSLPTYAPVANLQSGMLMSGFGMRINPWHKGKYHHDGVDIASPRDSPIMAGGHGKVTLVRHSNLHAGYGNLIEIDHGYGYVTRYANLGQILVRAGQRVNKGQSIALMGISGGSVAPHVHYEVVVNGKNVDPVTLMVEGVDSRQAAALARAASKPNQSLD